VPIAFRAAGIIVTSAVWIGAIAIATAQLMGLGVASLWPLVAVIGVVASIPIAATTVASKSDGAVDNASGVATVLDAIERVPRDMPLGVLIPSAEELGLAGARRWAQRYPAAVALNVDGVDDVGELMAVFSGRRPNALINRLERGAATEALTVRARRLLPGVLTDGVALADAGWEVVTLAKSGWHTLRRIHRPADSLARMTGTGIDEVARLVAATIRLGD
jgi:putative aminopeptidase FrvX